MSKIFTKICTGCGKELLATLEYFQKSINNKDGLQYSCKECCKKYYENNKEYKRKQQKEYDKNNKEKIAKYKKEWRGNNKKHIKEYRENHKKEIKEYNKEYRKNNKEKIVKQTKEYRKNHKKEKYIYVKNKLKTDINFKLIKNLRNRIREAIKNNSKSASTLELLGCTVEQARAHIEKQFKHGMSWEKYGIYGFHIDHIIPCSSFNLSDPEQQKECFNYKNLQPLWAKDNLSKGSKT